MHVHLQKEGGFAYVPGLNRPVSIDTSKLRLEQSQKLESMVREAGFFDLPPQIGEVPRGAADFYTYIITVEENGRSHTVQVTDPVTDPAIEKLINYVCESQSVR